MPPDFKMKDEYRVYLELEKTMELVSLPGWIATKENGEIDVHAHFTTSLVMDDKIVSMGGHLTTGTIASIKVIIVIGVIDDPKVKAAIDPNINQTKSISNTHTPSRSLSAGEGTREGKGGFDVKIRETGSEITGRLHRCSHSLCS